MFFFFFSLFPVFLWMFLFRSQYVLANLFFKKFHLLHLFCVRLDFSFFFLAKDRPVAIKSFCRSWRTKIASIKWSIDGVFFLICLFVFLMRFFAWPKYWFFWEYTRFMFYITIFWSFRMTKKCGHTHQLSIDLNRTMRPIKANVSHAHNFELHIEIKAFWFRGFFSFFSVFDRVFFKYINHSGSSLRIIWSVLTFAVFSTLISFCDFTLVSFLNWTEWWIANSCNISNCICFLEWFIWAFFPNWCNWQQKLMCLKGQKRNMKKKNIKIYKKSKYIKKSPRKYEKNL